LTNLPQEFVNKVVRLAIPYLVPFIAQEQAFTAAQTARLLTGFSLGYVTCQVPAGYISTALGPKFVQLCNNIGLTALFLGLPALARRGSLAAFGAVLGVGVLQGPFMIAHHGMSYNWSPPEDSPERPWARFIMHMGNHMSKVVGPTLTPVLAGRFGWQFVAKLYGCSFAGFAVLWQLCTSSHPPAALGGSESSPTAPDPEPEPAAAEKKAAVSMLSLLRTPPQLSCMAIQVTHDLIEFQTLGSWAPLYLHQVLGVPLGSVGSFTIWPMMVSLFGKFAVTAWESRMVAAGVDRLRLRKLSTAICSGCIFIFVPLFTLAPSPLLATLAYCGVTLGGCFEYPGFIANLLEVEGDDAMMLECVLCCRPRAPRSLTRRLLSPQGVQQPHRVVLGLRVRQRDPEAAGGGGRLVVRALPVAARRPAGGAAVLPEKRQHQHGAVVLREAAGARAAVRGSRRRPSGEGCRGRSMVGERWPAELAFMKWGAIAAF